MQLLAHLTRGCSPPSAPLLSAMLDLGNEIHWRAYDPAYMQLGVELAARLYEAAESGYFSAADAPLGSKAAEVVHCVLLTNCEPLYSLITTSSTPCCCLLVPRKIA
jgi:hypothetical protein